VVVGAYSSTTGRAYVFHSSGSSGVTITSAGSASSVITGEANSRFGDSVAMLRMFKVLSVEDDAGCSIGEMDRASDAQWEAGVVFI
ncbi:MAG: hypothetical protein AB1403_25090, partial [Candidatus Riflebacteria bacterium]